MPWVTWPNVELEAQPAPFDCVVQLLGHLGARLRREHAAAARRRHSRPNGVDFGNSVYPDRGSRTQLYQPSLLFRSTFKLSINVRLKRSTRGRAQEQPIVSFLPLKIRHRDHCSNREQKTRRLPAGFDFSQAKRVRTSAGSGGDRRRCSSYWRWSSWRSRRRRTCLR